MIEKLAVRNYKSLRAIDLSLRSFVTFVGPNNSGKSNILDCLAFIKDFVGQPAGAINGRGGFGDLVWNGDFKDTIAIKLEGRGSGSLGFSQRIKYVYEIELSGRPDGSFSTVREIFTARCEPFDGPADPFENQLLQSGVVALLEYPDKDGRAVIRDLSGKNVHGGAAGQLMSYLALVIHSPESFPVISHFTLGLRRWSFHNFVPSRM